MMADHFTNPVQVTKLRVFWGYILVVPEKVSVPNPLTQVSVKSVRPEEA